MNTGKTILLSIGIGIVTAILGAIVMQLQGKENIKESMLTFFIVGALLYLILEYSGAHKAFCQSYLS